MNYSIFYHSLSEESLSEKGISGKNAVYNQLNTVKTLLSSPMTAVVVFGMLQTIEPCAVTQMKDVSLNATELVLTRARSRVFHDRMENRLEEFSHLEKGWGNNTEAKPIHPAAIDAVRALLERLTEENLRGWSIFPDMLGSILLDYNSPIVSMAMSIGGDGYSVVKYNRDSFVSASYKSIDLTSMTSFMKNWRID